MFDFILWVWQARPNLDDIQQMMPALFAGILNLVSNAKTYQVRLKLLLPAAFSKLSRIGTLGGFPVKDTSVSILNEKAEIRLNR